MRMPERSCSRKSVSRRQSRDGAAMRNTCDEGAERWLRQKVFTAQTTRRENFTGRVSPAERYYMVARRCAAVVRIITVCAMGDASRPRGT